VIAEPKVALDVESPSLETLPCLEKIGSLFAGDLGSSLS
jgi:hypothetical protein